MVSVILDYFDGWAARKYNQCSFFGDVFDWVTDILTLALVLFWWNNIEPQFIVLSFSLLALEIATMVCDLVFKSADCEPKLDCDTWASVILKYTMHTEKRGYSGKGIGYWNQIFYFLCILSRILYVITENDVYLYLCASCVPLSVSYVWMHYAFTANIMEKWSEKYESNQIKLNMTE
jgi:phosphatidylglycerophosphate synthase